MTFGLVMIVKDAAGSIEGCLAAAIKAGITVATIVDTGSTDETEKLVEKHGFSVHRSSWVNFGHNRSEAFELAKGTADWLLALDADMTVEIDEGFVPDPSVEAYMIEMKDGGLSWRLPLLLRGDLPWRSVGAVHEYTTLDRPHLSSPTDAVRVKFPPTPSSPSKKHWHAGMLEEELAKDPENARDVFYLAQTYRELGDPRARILYLRRSAMGGFEEEAWYAMYRAALLAEWPERAIELMAAWDRRPTRAEPRYHLVKELNSRGLHHAAYPLSFSGIEEPDDLLFLEKWIWDWGLDFERSISAWWVGEKDEAAQLNRDLLRRTDLPDNVREAVKRNKAL